MDPRRRKRRQLAVILIAEIILAVFCIVVYLRGCNNATPAPGGPRQQQLKPKAPALLFAANELPGKYYFGDGLGVNCHLEIKPSHRFSFTWTGCEGVYDQNQGIWQLEGDVLVCKPEKPNRNEGFEGMGSRFIPVKWGKRIYLVDENEMPGFCAATASKDGVTKSALAEIHGEDYVKLEGEQLPTAEGKPTLPARFSTYYDRGPVEAQAVRIEQSGEVVLNKGGTDRLAPGILMTIGAFENVELRVRSVSPHEAVCEPLYFWNSAKSARIGDTFTTGSYWHRPHGTGYPATSEPPEVKKINDRHGAPAADSDHSARTGKR